MASVCQSWLATIPLRMQSTLLLGLRGPDTHACPEVKKIQRWLRGLVFRPGNPATVHDFMGSESQLPQLIEKGPLAKELEFCSQHFYSHLMHALEVVAYAYPDDHVGASAFRLFKGMCELMHLPVETEADFQSRLQTLEWPDGQPDTFEEAAEQLARVWSYKVRNDY